MPPCPPGFSCIQAFPPIRVITLNGTPPATSYIDSGLTSGGSYIYWVAACDAAGNCSAQSAAATATTPDTAAPTVPTGLTATAVSATQISLAWVASYDYVGVTQYRINRNGVAIGIATGRSYIDTGLTSATSYSYTVTACDAAGNCSTQSAAATATTRDNVAPSVPTGLTTSAISGNQINLFWTASTDNVGVTGYTVYRNGIQVGTATVTSYIDTGLISATSYSYTVTACDAAGNCSTQSAAATATTRDNVAPSVPTGLTAGASSATKINLAWTASTDNVGVTGYKVYRNGVQVGTSPVTTSYSDSGLTTLTSYSYTVAACDAAGNCSVQSVTGTATTLEGVPPTVPTKLAAMAFSTTQINLTWRASTDNVGVTGYRVYRNGVQAGTSTGISYSDTGLTAASSYSYTVAACDAATNCSAQSTAVTGTTKRR